jgi:hypothetical protein
MRRTLILYSPSIVLAGWAIAWAAGATTNGVMVGALVAEAVAIWLHVREQLRRFNGRPVRPVRARRRAEDRRRSYRDVWLIAISVVVLWSTHTGQDTADDAKRASRDAKTAAETAKKASQKNRVAILQNCSLTLARLADNTTRLQQAVDYVNDPRNTSENPGLVRTVKTISIPFNVRQIKVDRKRFPSSCGSPPNLPRSLRPLFRRRLSP